MLRLSARCLAALLCILAGLAASPWAASAAGLAGGDPLTPRPIALRATTLPAAHLAAITRQSHVAFVTAPDDLFAATTWRPIALDLAGKSFWQATRALCLQADLTTGADDARPDRVRLWKVSTTSQFRGPAASAGPILLVANTLRRAKPAAATLEARVFVDPATNVYAHSQALEIAQLTDAKGQALTPVLKPRLVHSARALLPMILTINTPVRTPEELGPTVTLKGAARFLVPAALDSADIPLTQAATTAKTLAGLRITIKSLDYPDATHARLTLTIQRGSFPQELWAAMTAERHAYLQIALADAAGRMLPGNPARPPAGTESFEYRYQFDFMGVTAMDDRKFEPTRLLLEAPTAIKELTVPLDLADIPVSGPEGMTKAQTPRPK